MRKTAKYADICGRRILIFKQPKYERPFVNIIHSIQKNAVPTFIIIFYGVIIILCIVSCLCLVFLFYLCRVRKNSKNTDTSLMNMKKKTVFILMMALATISASAQNSYIVKTRGAKKAAVTKSTATATEDEAEPEARDFIGENFRFYSLCDWQEGMKFMVMPEKYDLIVNTFCDAATGKEVSSGRLRHKIMIYKGHTETPEGFALVNFLCTDDNKNYYYRIPNGTFEDYCYGKLGVPTLAYLGDVDIAREKLIGMKLYTKATRYRVDTEMDGDGFEEISVPLNEEVTVRAVGAGSRSCPVKIIVEDKKGREFYQSVAMSKTNSGMRDDEFIMDKAKFLFAGSFELADANIAASNEYSKYIGRNVYTKYPTKMENASGVMVGIARLSTFRIEKIQTQNGTRYVRMTLKSTNTGETFVKQVTFVNVDIAGDIDGAREDYYGYLFGAGIPEGLKGLSEAKRKMIQEGRVAVGFTKREVRMAKGEPDKHATAGNGRTDWIYNDGTIVKFTKDGKAFKIEHH